MILDVEIPVGISTTVMMPVTSKDAVAANKEKNNVAEIKLQSGKYCLVSKFSDKQYNAK